MTTKRNFLIVEIDPETHAQIKLWAKRRGITLRRYATNALRQALANEVWKDDTILRQHDDDIMLCQKGK